MAIEPSEEHKRPIIQLVVLLGVIALALTNPSRDDHENYFSLPLGDDTERIARMGEEARKELELLKMMRPSNPAPIVTVDYNNYFVFSTAARRLNGRVVERSIGYLNKVRGWDGDVPRAPSD